MSCIHYDIIFLPLYTHTVPTQPRNFTLEPVIGAPTQLQASWIPPDPSNGLILSYTVRCVTAAQTPIIVAIVGGDSVTVLLEGLSPFTFYTCYVSANTSAGEGLSANESARTDEGGMYVCVDLH